MDYPRRTFLQGAMSLSAGAVLLPRRALAQAGGWTQVWSAPTYVTQTQVTGNRPPRGYPANHRFAVGTSPGGEQALTETIVDFNPGAARINGYNPTYVWHWQCRLPRTKVSPSAKGYAARNYIYITANPKSSGKAADGKWDSLCIGVNDSSNTGATSRNQACSLMTMFKTSNGYCEIRCGFEGITPNNGQGGGYHYLAVGGGSGRVNPGRWYCMDRYMVPESRAGGRDGVAWIDIDGRTVSKFSTCRFFESSWWGNINYMHDLVRHMWGGNEDDYPPDYPAGQPMKHYIKRASRHICMDRASALSLKLPAPTNYN